VQNRILQLVEDANKKPDVPDFRVGATVEVHQRILEGQKERIQIFTGDVIARKGAGVRETFTVRKIVQGEGVERVFLVHSPKIAKILIKRRGVVRRAKLYYLRKRVGKATRLKEQEKASPAKSAPKAATPAPAAASPTA
jgi:large subunit ribosomal protein L19